jgi:hypothetical protein
MASRNRVSMWGPNAQGVRSRPSRAVSLRDVRDLPVQRMGFSFDEFDRLVGEGTSEGERNPWDLVEDPATGELVERSQLSRASRERERVRRRLAEGIAVGDAEQRIIEAARLFRQGRYQEAHDIAEEIAEEYEIPGVTADGIMVDIEIQAGHLDRLVGLSDEDRQFIEQPGGFTPSPPMSGVMPGASLQPPQLPDTGGFTPLPPMSGLLPGAPIRGPQGPIITSSGLTADQAFRQHLAMSGRQDPNQGYFPGFEGPNERIDRDRREAKEKVRPRTPEEQAEWERKSRQRGNPQNPPPVPPPVPPPPPNRVASPLVSQMSGPDWDAIEEGDYGTAPWWDAVPGLDALDDDVFEDPYGDEGEFNPWDPDARSMDSQMLADLNMRRARQDQQGYFGWAGDAVSSLADTVSGMSNTERAALVAALVAAGVLTVGSGGALAPAAAGLAGAAGLGALSNAP